MAPEQVPVDEILLLADVLHSVQVRGVECSRRQREGLRHAPHGLVVRLGLAARMLPRKKLANMQWKQRCF